MTGGFYGADVDQLRQAGQRLAQAADSLDRIAALIGQQVNRTQWHGPDADRFRGAWDGAHRRALATAVATLRGAAATLERNAEAQHLVSRPDAGTSGFGPTHPWSLASAAARDDIAAVRDAADAVLESRLPGTAWSVDQLAGLLPGVGTGVTAYDAISKLTRGQLPWHEAIDLASGVIDKGTPLTYGIGVDMRLWADVIDTGQHFFSGDTAHGGMDWSNQGMADLWNGIRNPQVVAYTARETLNQLAPMLAGVFKP